MKARSPNFRFRETQPRRGRYHQITSATEDLGCTYYKQRGNNNLVRVKAWPAKGQYTFNEKTGTYEFSTADARRLIVIHYITGLAS